MSLFEDRDLVWLIGGILSLLALATVVGWVLKGRAKSEAARATVDNLVARINAWWAMVAVFGIAIATGGYGSMVMFAAVSFLALREFITLLPTRRADHRAMVWTFFLFLPAQYFLVAIGWYGLFALLIPVYAYLLLPSLQVLAGDNEDFLARTSRLQWVLMICVFCVSHAPALLMLEIPDYEGQNAKLLLYLVVVTEVSDVLQSTVGKLFERRKAVPTVSPNKTVEGYVGGGGLAVALGAALWWATPFNPWQAALMALVIVLAGIAGGLVMSADRAAPEIVIDGRRASVREMGDFRHNESNEWRHEAHPWVPGDQGLGRRRVSWGSCSLSCPGPSSAAAPAASVPT